MKNEKLGSQMWRWGFIGRVTEMIEGARRGAGSKVVAAGDSKHYLGKRTADRRDHKRLAKSRRRTANISRRINRQRQS